MHQKGTDSRTSAPIHDLIAAIPLLAFARSLPAIQDVVKTTARRLAAADGATFVLRDDDQCFYADEDAVAPLWKGRRFPMSACVSGWAMRHREPAVIEDIYADDRVPHDAYRPTFVKSLVMVPIRTADPLGAIGTYWAVPHRATAEEITLLQGLADSTAVALENVRVYRALEEAQLETLQRLALAGEYRDDATHAHTKRVGYVVGRLARAIGQSDADATLLSQASLLHDVGKIAVPDAVLLKRGKLTPQEQATMKRHAENGAALLAGSKSPVLILAQEIALSHHEWWDGSGYPKGLRGEAIPISGRIVAVADAFDAITHERPYRPACPVREAAEEIAAHAGRQFDPFIVDALLALDLERLAALPDQAHPALPLRDS
ncbi:MAG: HD-GYP domain-containing protein [Vicinamibacterales bacterium]